MENIIKRIQKYFGFGEKEKAVGLKNHKCCISATGDEAIAMGRGAYASKAWDNSIAEPTSCKMWSDEPAISIGPNAGKDVNSKSIVIGEKLKESEYKSSSDSTGHRGSMC